MTAILAQRKRALLPAGFREAGIVGAHAARVFPEISQILQNLFDPR